VIRRKPLYYVINLIIPTSIITLVAITGFFTPASTADDRTEKINLGITTLLAMSILMLMASFQLKIWPNKFTLRSVIKCQQPVNSFPSLLGSICPLLLFLHYFFGSIAVLVDLS
jgi:hypothetical protein